MWTKGTWDNFKKKMGLFKVSFSQIEMLTVSFSSMKKLTVSF